MSAEDKKKIEDAKERLALAVKENEADLRPATDNLNNIWSEVSTRMYGQAGGPQGNQGQNPGGEQQSNPNPGNEAKPNVEEADYTVVDD
jgi:hypothetical protein